MFFILCEVIFMRFTSSPPFIHQEKSVLCSTRNYASVWKDLEKTSIFGAELNLCPIAEFFKWPVWSFSTSSRSSLLAEFFGTFQKFLESSSAKSARYFSTNRGVPGIPTCWTCATQPGLPPLRAQFRFGVSIDWTSFFISRFR